jgi:transposase
MDTIPEAASPPATTERLAYSIEEAAAMLGVHYFSVYRLIQAREVEAVPRPARQAVGASLRTAQTVEVRMRTARL